MDTKHLPLLLFVLVALAGTGCTAINTFGLVARAGDTVAVGLGYQQDLTRWNTQITITDSNSIQTVYTGSSPEYRAIINNYPDPVSRMIVNRETGLGPSIEAFLIEGAVTFGDKDYSETILILDLPATMVTGMATIAVTDDLGNPVINPYTNTAITKTNVEILPGAGSPDTFDNQEFLTIFPSYLRAQERAPHYKISFQGSTIPYAIELDMAHGPDIDNGGTGRAHVANARGDLKTINWTDDGFNLSTIILPAKSQTLADMQHFRFYVAGGLTGLIVNNVAAYDIDGNPVAGVTAVIE